MHLYLSTSISHFLDNAVSNFLHLLFCTQPAFSLNMYSGHLVCLLMAIFSTHSLSLATGVISLLIKNVPRPRPRPESTRALKTSCCLLSRLFWTVAQPGRPLWRVANAHQNPPQLTLLVLGQCGCVKKRKGKYARSVKSNPSPALFVCVRVLSVLYYYYYWCCACAFLLY